VWPRQRIAARTARHRQPKTDVDEQPASSVPGSRGDAVPALLAPAPRPSGGTSAKLEHTVSNERLNNGWVWVHDLLLLTRTLVTRIVVTRLLVKSLALAP
jgi:hypothetical protein